MFAFGFAKSDQSNIDDNDERELKKAAKIILELSEETIEVQLIAGKFEEVICNAKERE